MKDALKKLKKLALSSGLASEFHANPSEIPAKDSDIDVVMVLKPEPVKPLKPRDLKPGEKLEPAESPLERAKDLLVKAGLTYVQLRYFPAASRRSAAIRVSRIAMTAVADKAAAADSKEPTSK